MRNYNDVLESIQLSENLEASLKLTNELLLDIREALMSNSPEKAKVYPLPPVAKKEQYEPLPDDVSVFHLPVSTGLRTSLQHGGIRYLSQLRHYSQYEIMQFRQMGKVYMKELLTVLKGYDMDIPEFP